MNELQNLSRSLSDFFTKDILKLAIIPLIASITILYTIFFSTLNSFLPDNGDIIQIEQTHTTTENGITTITQETTIQGGITQTILNYILKSTFTSWLMSFLIYTVGSVLVIILSIFISIIVISFLTPTILKIIQKRHYHQIELKSYGSFISGLWIVFKSFFMMIFLMLVLIPLYFIPIINVIAFNIPFFYMFHKVLTFDITSSMMSEDEYARIKAKHGDSFVARSLLLYILSLIPFMGLFIPLFYVVYLGNSYFIQLEYLYNIDNTENIVEQNDNKDDKNNLLENNI